ncbi:MAG TPA: porin family protein [Pyrinomonadaceae bacterium]|nr:porin family protein [Pyrinomonadaceae bacterium]
MLKRTTFASALICLLPLLCQTAAAQTGPDRKSFEVGAHFSVLNYDDYGDYGVEPGFGGRFGFNLNEHLALEAEVNFYPRSHELDPTVSGRKTLALFGVKAGARRGSFGLFGKARPGFIYFSRRLSFACVGLDEPSDCELSRTNFAFDVGGVVEYDFSPRVLLRVDLGDTIIRSSIIGGTNTTHNLQLNAGVGFRF